VEPDFICSEFIIMRTAILARSSRPCGLWARDERGSVAILTGISLTVLIAFAGLGVDVSMWLRAKSNVQSAADAAANSVAAAAALPGGSSSTRIQAEANAAAAANGFENGMNGVTVVVHNPPTSGTYAGKTAAYEIIVSAPQKLYLASVLSGPKAPTVVGRTVALLNTTSLGPTCILGLSPLAKAVDVTFNGNTAVVAHGCDVDADSPSASSINTNGGGSVTAANIFTVGGISGNNVTLDCGAVGSSGCGNTYIPSTIKDPYSGITMPPMPTSFAPHSENSWSGNISNPTGIIAFNGDVNVTGNTTLAAGIYIINNGGFNSPGQYSVDGTAGVTIILTSSNPASDNGTFSITGGGALNINAPTSAQLTSWGLDGSTAGIALWADGNLPNKQDKFAGGTTNGLNGAIYLPSHDVKFAGNSSSSNNNGCTQLIAYNIVFTGTSNFYHNCTGLGVKDPPGPSQWSLVE
jgi:Flp pilus assembly protein TadG